MISITKDMEVGVAKIDEQHRELVDRINAITRMGSRSFSKEETQKTLDLLGKYVVQHFGDEEILQIQCKYPKYEWHKALHQEFIDGFVKVKEEFENNGSSFKFVLELYNGIVSWIVRHIKTVDVEFGKYYISKMAVR
jgi:hemerythrin